MSGLLQTDAGHYGWLALILTGSGSMFAGMSVGAQLIRAFPSIPHQVNVVVFFVGIAFVWFGYNLAKSRANSR